MCKIVWKQTDDYVMTAGDVQTLEKRIETALSDGGDSAPIKIPDIVGQKLANVIDMMLTTFKETQIFSLTKDGMRVMFEEEYVLDVIKQMLGEDVDVTAAVGEE